MPSDRSTPLRSELARIARFIMVGLFNTIIGYGFILAALFLGAGDYLANAIGFALGWPIAYAFHRWFTFRVERPASTGEASRYIVAFLLAYGTNIGVVAAGRALGFVESPLVQLVAICVYAGVFYVLSRLIVFPSTGSASSDR